MTAAYRLKGLGWLGGCSLVLLGFYLVSIQVAAERKKLDQVDARIRVAQRDIRALETEFDVRANLVQLERWNGDTLALVAPGAGQFVRDESALAAISFNGQPNDSGVQVASYVVPSVPVTVAPAAIEAPAAGLVQVAAKAVIETPQPRMMKAVAVRAAPTESGAVKAVAVKATIASTKKAQAVAMLDRTLLSDSTLGDLMSGARAERGRLR